MESQKKVPSTKDKQYGVLEDTKNLMTARPLFKPIFQKIRPITISSICEPDQIEDFEEVQQKVKIIKKFKSRPSLLENIFQVSQKVTGRVQVNWNSFFKLKKKNYLEEYIYGKQIGRGSFGTVVKAKMKYGTHSRAIKIIKESAAFHKDSNKLKLYSEISIPISFDHPNIAKIYEVFEWKRSIGIVMQLCEGGDLFTFIKNQKKFTQKTAASIFKQIMHGVHYMHKKGISHRDLKPENILYATQSCSVKLIDFGTASEINKNRPFTAVVGTPFYIAPEVIGKKYNEKCDIWSCGVILYIILSGSPPFQGKNQKEIFQNILSQPLNFNSPIWSKRSAQVKELIVGMMSKDPVTRLNAEQVLSSPWCRQTLFQSRPSVQIGSQIVANLKNFHFQNKLKAVVYTFIASQLYENKDKEDILSVFKQIDKDGDGVIERQELIQIFESCQTSLPIEEIERILKIIDTNGSGRIDFTQFLVAASNQEQLLKRKQLQNAFAYLDTDHSGFITIDEVRTFLDSSEQTGEEIRQIFNQVDANGDGQISKSQFIALLLGHK